MATATNLDAHSAVAAVVAEAEFDVDEALHRVIQRKEGEARRLLMFSLLKSARSAAAAAVAGELSSVRVQNGQHAPLQTNALAVLKEKRLSLPLLQSLS